MHHPFSVNFIIKLQKTEATERQDTEEEHLKRHLSHNVSLLHGQTRRLP